MMQKSHFVTKEMPRLFIVFLVISSVLLSCTSDSGRSRISSESAPITVFDPIDRDFEDIKESGVLRMITFYSSNTYFLNQGIEVGFEYELLREFARENDLAVEVIIVGADENPFDLLNKGVGDVIAANYTITPERKRVAGFTRPYNIVDQMIVYSSEQIERPQTLEELSESGIPISVRRSSSYYSRLNELNQQGYDFNIDPVSDGMDTEAALFQVADGNLEATVADDNMYQASSRYMEGLYPGPTIAESDTIAWAIRSNATELESRMNRYLYKHFRFSEDKGKPRRSTFLNVLRKKYFERSRQMAQYYDPEWQFQSMGVISPYDEMIRSVADSMDLDWLLLTAMIAQESSFNPNSQRGSTQGGKPTVHVERTIALATLNEKEKKNETNAGYFSQEVMDQHVLPAYMNDVMEMNAGVVPGCPLDNEDEVVVEEEEEDDDPYYGPFG